MSQSAESLTTALDRAARAPHLLVALDFDGTLAPFTDDPADSRALPRAQAALETLSGLPGTTVAIISGRPLEFLRTVVDPRGRLVHSGSHGAEFDLTALSGGAHEISLSTEQLELLDEAVDAAHSLVQKYPGSRAELKPAGVCFHVRPMTDRELAARALQDATTVFAHMPGLRLTPGQEVIECSVLGATKGDGLRAIQDACAPDVTLFAGDDVTDEDALSLLGDTDVGIKVGDKPSCASHRLASPQELADVLDTLAARRASAGPTVG